MAGRGTDIILGGNPKVGIQIWILVCFFMTIECLEK
jgi:preprotein translocase subunit SecA